MAVSGSSGAGIGIVYATHRRDPRLDWFVESLSAQLVGSSPVELLVVDGLYTPERAAALERLVAGRFGAAMVPPKPSPYNGAHRLTRDDLFAAANARNTGAVYSRQPYLVFVDDCSVLAPGWLDAALEAADAGRVVAGAYEKREAMRVEGGVLVESVLVEAGRDSRAEHAPPGELVRIPGGQLYGSSFGVPRELLVAVNGLDELCDPMGGEDYHLGIRLELAGAEIYYDRRLLTIEAQSLDAVGESPRRIGRSLAEDAYLAKLAEFGVAARSTDGSFDNSHMVLDLVYGTGESAALGNDFDLATLVPADFEALPRAFPDAYWFDGTPLAEL